MGRTRLLTLGAALSFSGACYSYTAVPAARLQPGERVRVRVSGARADQLEPVLGRGDRRIEGEVLQQSDTDIALAVDLAPSSESRAIVDARTQQRIVIPRGDIQEAELRHLDKLRTSLLLGGAVAGVVAIAVAKGTSLLGGSNAGGSPNENRVPQAIPLVKWRVAIP